MTNKELPTMEEALGIATSKAPKLDTTKLVEVKPPKKHKAPLKDDELGSNMIGHQGKKRKDIPPKRSNHSGTIKEIHDKLFNGITIPCTINYQHYNFVNGQETTFTITTHDQDTEWEKYMLDNKKSLEVFGSRMANFKVGSGEYHTNEKFSRLEITYKFNV